MSFKLPEKFRKKHASLGSGDHSGGYFVIPIEDNEAHCLASNGGGWEHVSIHIWDKKETLTPIWDEMCIIKDVFWDKSDCVLQYHPPESEYVNNHPNVLHLWRPSIGTVKIPMPPSIFVGIK